VVTLEAYESVHSVNGSSLPTSGSSVFGWIERDALIANSATDDSEIVYYADTVHVHAEVHINPCYTWCVVVVVVAVVVVAVVVVVVVVVVADVIVVVVVEVLVGLAVVVR